MHRPTYDEWRYNVHSHFHVHRSKQQQLPLIFKIKSSVAQLASASDCYPFRLMAHQEVESSSLSGGDNKHSFFSSSLCAVEACDALFLVAIRGCGSLHISSSTGHASRAAGVRVVLLVVVDVVVQCAMCEVWQVAGCGGGRNVESLSASSDHTAPLG